MLESISSHWDKISDIHVRLADAAGPSGKLRVWVSRKKV